MLTANEATLVMGNFFRKRVVLAPRPSPDKIQQNPFSSPHKPGPFGRVLVCCGFSGASLWSWLSPEVNPIRPRLDLD